MIGMKLGAFLMLLVLGFIAAIVIHSIIRYRMVRGLDGFLAKWVAGWIGGWLGSPVLGHWWFRFQNVYIIPALVGAFTSAFACVYMVKAFGRTSLNAMTPATASAVVPEILRKVS